MNNISDKIKLLMADKKVSYGELSNMTKIPKSALQRYATGETNNIPLDRIIKIASALNSTPEYIMGWETEESKKEGAALLRETPIGKDIIIQALNRLTDEELRDIVKLAEYLVIKRDD